MRVIICLIALALFLVVSPSSAFDREKLMLLDPLPSTRIKRIADEAENNRLLKPGIFGLGGAWMVINNVGKGADAYRINNILSGSSFLLTSVVDLMETNSLRSDFKIVKELGSQSEEKEILAYFEIRSQARNSFAARRTTAMLYFLSFLSSAAIAGNSPDLSDSERSFANMSAAGFLFLAAQQMFWPTAVELAAGEIDKELAK